MFQRVIQIENEIEWLKIKDLLEEHEIPYSFRKTNDSAFPSLNENSIQIIIPEQFSQLFFRLTEKEFNSKIIQTESKPSKSWIIPLFLILYGVGMTFLFLKYYKMHSRNSSDKNFEYHWSFNNTRLQLKHKTTKEITSIFYDENFDFNYEKIEDYFKHKKVGESFDLNEDGFPEIHNFYGKNGQYAGSNIDSDKDRLFDKLILVLENNDSLIFIDQNRNGIYERLK